MKQLIYIVFFISVTHFGLAQQDDFAQQEVNVDDLGNVSDDFQENFFEALKQKAIENYGRAVTALQACLKTQPNNAVIHFELGKNYNFLKQYVAAEESLKKALSFKPNNEDILNELYDVQFNNNDYISAQETVKKLIKVNVIYKEDLAKLYQRTKDFSKAIEQLDELDKLQGASYYRDNLRRVIYRQSTNKQEQALALENRIGLDPDNIQNYLNLIFIYSEMNAIDKAFKTALKLQQNHPETDLAHLALYKGYLAKGDVDEAIASMKIVLKSNQIDKETKGKVLKDFMQYATEKPELEDSVTEILSDEDTDRDPKELALFYLKEQNTSKALQYFKLALEDYPTDYDVLKNLSLLQIDAQEFQDAVVTTEKALAVYPSQPLLYLTQGVAYNNLSKFEEALEALEFGLDYIIDNAKLEADLFNQMSVAHQGLGNTQKATEFKQRASKALNQSN